MTNHMLVAFILVMLAAVVVYFKMIMVLQCFTEEEFEEIPMGNQLYRIMKRL